MAAPEPTTPAQLPDALASASSSSTSSSSSSSSSSSPSAARPSSPALAAGEIDLLRQCSYSSLASVSSTAASTSSKLSVFGGAVSNSHHSLVSLLSQASDDDNQNPFDPNKTLGELWPILFPNYTWLDPDDERQLVSACPPDISHLRPWPAEQYADTSPPSANAVGADSAAAASARAASAAATKDSMDDGATANADGTARAARVSTFGNVTRMPQTRSISIDVVNTVKRLDASGQGHAGAVFNWRMDVRTAHEAVDSVTFVAPVQNGPPPEAALVSSVSVVGIEHHYHAPTAVESGTGGVLMEVPQVLIVSVAETYFIYVANDLVVNRNSCKQHRRVFTVLPSMSEVSVAVERRPGRQAVFGGGRSTTFARIPKLDIDDASSSSDDGDTPDDGDAAAATPHEKARQNISLSDVATRIVHLQRERKLQLNLLQRKMLVHSDTVARFIADNPDRKISAVVVKLARARAERYKKVSAANSFLVLVKKLARANHITNSTPCMSRIHAPVHYCSVDCPARLGHVLLKLKLDGTFSARVAVPHPAGTEKHSVRLAEDLIITRRGGGARITLRTLRQRSMQLLAAFLAHRNCQLEYLSLAGNDFGERGELMEQLAEDGFKRNKSIRTLILDRCELGSRRSNARGLATFAKLLHNLNEHSFRPSQVICK